MQTVLVRASFAAISRSTAKATRSSRSAFVGRPLLFMGNTGSAANAASPMATSAALASAYDAVVKDAQGATVPLSKYKGKVALIVNVASACGLTQGNYKELTELQNKFAGKPFEILAFPCNQFGGQEPGPAAQVCTFAGKFGAKFPIFEKVDVNGPNTEPLYTYLKSQKGTIVSAMLGSDIKWNFGKFLVDKEGKVVARYEPTTSPLAIEADIAKLL